MFFPDGFRQNAMQFHNKLYHKPEPSATCYRRPAKQQDNLSLHLTNRTEWMLFKKIVLSCIIPMGRGTFIHTVMAVHPVIFTEHLSLFAEFGTFRAAAGPFRIMNEDTQCRRLSEKRDARQEAKQFKHSNTSDEKCRPCRSSSQ